MKRRWIRMRDLEMYDDFHMKDGDSFIVDEEKDGNTTEYHKEGVKIIKDIIEKGAKILPILVVDNEDGSYSLLDGFKRSRAHFELNKPLIEAFIVTREEHRRAVEIPFQNHQMRAWKGGQPFEYYGLLEGGEQEDFDYEKTKFLYKSEDPHGLRIEVSECIHVHWSEYGRYRLALGRRDFVALAKAITQIDG